MYSYSKKIKNEQFVDSSLINDFKCPVCHNIIQPEVIETPCKHKFCKECLDNISRSNKSMIFPCPMCREEVFIGNLTLCEKDTLKIMNSKIICNVCKIECLYKDFDKHYCTMGLISCKYCCYNIYRNEYSDHIKRCMNFCNQCKVIIKDNDHLCGGDIIKCYNNGCEYRSERRNIFSHISICKYKIITCKWCLEKILVKNIKFHNNICKGKHRLCLRCKSIIPITKNYFQHQEECEKNNIKSPTESNSESRSESTIGSESSESNNDDVITVNNRNIIIELDRIVNSLS